jgi:hypothetical protein
MILGRISLGVLSSPTTQAKVTVQIVNDQTRVEVRNPESEVQFKSAAMQRICRSLLYNMLKLNVQPDIWKF